MRTALAFLVASASVACGPAPHTRAAGALTPLAVRAVAWNPAKTAVGKVSAVADAGNVVTVFSDRGATVFSARAVVATDRTVTDWLDAGAIYGADGSSRWIVGVSAEGRMYYLRGEHAFVDVTDRYGLGKEHVLGAVVLGAGEVGFLLGGEVAVADGVHVTRYSLGGLTFAELAGGPGVGAGVAPGGVHALDVSHGSMVDYSLPGAAHAAFDPSGRLYAATSRAVYAVDPQGRLALVYDAEADTLHGLVASGDRVWFADGDELGVVEGDRVAETRGARIGAHAKLRSSASGDVWVLADGELSRFARAEGERSTAGSWAASIAPIFARSCSSCHQPDGPSGTDLSTAAAWEGERSHIQERVVERRSMPPQGHPLSDEDRDAIRRWVEGD